MFNIVDPMKYSAEKKKPGGTDAHLSLKILFASKAIFIIKNYGAPIDGMW